MVFRWLIEWEGVAGRKSDHSYGNVSQGNKRLPQHDIQQWSFPSTRISSSLQIIAWNYRSWKCSSFKGKTLSRVGNYVTDLYIRNFFENSLVRPTLVYINYNLRVFSTLSHYVGYHFGLWSSELVFCNMNHTNWTNNYYIFSNIRVLNIRVGF